MPHFPVSRRLRRCSAISSAVKTCVTTAVRRSGFIDRAELRELLNSTDGGKEALNTALWLSDADLDAVMAKYDTDGNGTISFDEFGSLVR